MYLNKLLYILLIAVATAKNCTYLYDSQYYTKHPVLYIKGMPTNLAYNKFNNDIHFTLLHTLDEAQTEPDQYVLRNDQAIKIDKLKGLGAAVDNINNKVYIGTTSGLAVIDNSLEANYTNFDGYIIHLFKLENKNILYATYIPKNEVYKIDLDTNDREKINTLTKSFFLAVDNDENIYYFDVETESIKVLLKDYVRPIEYVGFPKNWGKAMTIDSNGRAILVTEDGLYHLRPDNVIPIKLMNLDEVASGIVFNGDAFYLGLNGGIYKYTPMGCPKKIN